MLEGPEPINLGLWPAAALKGALAERERLLDILDRAHDELRRCYSITIGDKDGETNGLYRAIGIALDILAEADPETGGRMGPE